MFLFIIYRSRLPLRIVYVVSAYEASCNSSEGAARAAHFAPIRTAAFGKSGHLNTINSDTVCTAGSELSQLAFARFRQHFQLALMCPLWCPNQDHLPSLKVTCRVENQPRYVPSRYLGSRRVVKSVH